MRGNIYDRGGVLLAGDKPIFNIAVIPYQIQDEKEVLFKMLAGFLKIKEDMIYACYEKNFLNAFSPVDILINLTKEDALKVKNKFEDKVAIRALPQRTYTYPFEFSHLLGYVKREQVSHLDIKEYGYSLFERKGKNGLEMYYNGYLQGEDGADLLEVDSEGRVVGYLGTKGRKKGKDLHLTIDSRIQQAAYEALGNWKGVLIYMNPHSGEILAFVSKPSFNLNNFIEGKEVEKILNNPAKPLINRGIQSRYPPGSVFKPLVALAGLEEKLITPSTTYNCLGKLKIGGVEFKCWHPHGKQSLLDAIAHSCNVYFYNLGLKLKVERLTRWARMCRLHQCSLIDLPFEKEGLIPDRTWKKKNKKTVWFAGDTVNFSIGQGYLEITPLRIALFVSIFANGGHIVHPYLAHRVEKDIVPHQGAFPLRVSKTNLSLVKKGLREAVARGDGTAHILDALDLSIAGKTGTAQTRDKSHGWFVGFFPYDLPRYTVCVFLENAGSSHEALMVCYSFLMRLKNDNLI